MKKSFLVLIYFICILYSLEILSFFFIINRSNTIIGNNKAEKIIEFKTWGESRNKNNVYPSFSLQSIKNLDIYFNNPFFKDFLEEKILSEKKIPFRGPINKLSLDSDEDGIMGLVINDKYGFKNDNKNYENAIDVMIIGDSFAEGVPFGNKDDVSGLINLNSDYNSINYGISGAGPLNSLGVLREYGKNFKPRNIFYFFYEGNDIKDLSDEKKSYLVKYLNRSFNQDLFNSETELQSFLNSYEKLFFKNLPNIIELENTNKKNLNSRSVIKLSFIENLQDILEFKKLKQILIPKDAYFNKNKKLDYASFEKVIIEMQHEVDKWDGKLTLIYLPSWTRYDRIFSIAHKIIKKKIKNITLKNNVTFIDMDRVFKKNLINDIYLFNSAKYGHYTKRGYKKIADTIIEKLEAK